MGTSVVALVPVWRRPQNLAPLVESWNAALEPEVAEMSMLFLASPGDEAEIAELERLGLWYVVVPWQTGDGEWARKQNYGMRMTVSEWLFTGADDLRFHPGWLSACLRVHARTGALVIGTNDLANPSVKRGRYATHILIHRSYATRAVIDSPGLMFFEGYRHNCPDTECIETAKANRVYAPARHAHVEHLHPAWHTAPDDEVYRKGRVHHAQDRALFDRRRKLWRHRFIGRARAGSSWRGRGRRLWGGRPER